MIPSDYLLLGWKLLPVQGKIPVTSRGVKDASDHPIDIAFYFYDKYNVAITPADNWVVVDVDPRNGGFESLAALEFEHGEFPSTVRAKSGGGGEHYLYHVPPKTLLKGKLAPGIDIIGPGKYFLVEPSIHPSGNVYKWITSPFESEIAAMPSWMLSILNRDESITTSCAIVLSDDRTRRAEQYIDKCDPAISGQNGHLRTFKIALALIVGFALEFDEALPIFEKWNQRCSPPWSKRDLVRKLKEVQRSTQVKRGYLLNDNYRQSSSR